MAAHAMESDATAKESPATRTCCDRRPCPRPGVALKAFEGGGCEVELVLTNTVVVNHVPVGSGLPLGLRNGSPAGCAAGARPRSGWATELTYLDGAPELLRHDGVGGGSGRRLLGYRATSRCRSEGARSGATAPTPPPMSGAPWRPSAGSHVTPRPTAAVCSSLLSIILSINSAIRGGTGWHDSDCSGAKVLLSGMDWHGTNRCSRT